MNPLDEAALARLRELAEKASPAPWYHCQPFMVVPKQRTVHGTVPAQRVDFVSTKPAPVHERTIIPMPPENGPGVRSEDMAFIAAFNPVVARALLDMVERQRKHVEDMGALIFRADLTQAEKEARCGDIARAASEPSTEERA